jgi:uncharacterized protein with von Willebrand factor type A (vWA) domain
MYQNTNVLFLIKNSFQKSDGWKFNNFNEKILTIGNYNFSDHDNIEDFTLKQEIINVLTKYNIDYKLYLTNNKIQFTYDIILNKENYDDLKKKINL